MGTFVQKRDMLTRIWGEVFPDLDPDSPLHAAIIREIIDGADPLMVENVNEVCDNLIDDVTRFRDAIVDAIEAAADCPKARGEGSKHSHSGGFAICTGE